MFIGAQLTAHYNQVTQELRLASNDDQARVRWLGGLYAYRVDNNGAAHLKSAILGPGETIPVRDGKLLLGRWQAIMLVELAPTLPMYW